MFLCLLCCVAKKKRERKKQKKKWIDIKDAGQNNVMIFYFEVDFVFCERGEREYFDIFDFVSTSYRRSVIENKKIFYEPSA